MLDLNTWLAAAADEGDHGEDAPPSASSNTLDRARLDLDPPGFACKAFHDLTVCACAVFLFLVISVFWRRLLLYVYGTHICVLYYLF